MDQYTLKALEEIEDGLKMTINVKGPSKDDTYISKYYTKEGDS